MVKPSLVLAVIIGLLGPLSVIAQSASPTVTGFDIQLPTTVSPSSSPSQTSYSTGDESGNGDSSAQAGANAGASGKSTGFVNMSKGVEVAIIVVAVLVGGGGIASAVFYYIAKKRQWEVRKSIRRSARRLTNNFSTTNLQKAARRQTGVHKMSDNVPPTPKMKERPQPKPKPENRDIEKTAGTDKASEVKSEFELDSPKRKTWGDGVHGFGKKFGR